MRTFSFLLAIATAILCWGISAAISSGVAPLGKVGASETITFITPIGLFAAPLALYAFVRTHTLMALWICAIAPILGGVNFALSLLYLMGSPDALNVVDTKGAPSFALAWLILLSAVLGALALRKRRSEQQKQSPRTH